MRTDVCLCAIIPRLPTRTRVVLLMHWTESLATTNTGRLAALALPNSEIRLRGLKDQPMSTEALVSEERETLLLYPDDDAEVLSAPPERPVTLLVPDGTWRQASKVARREPALAGVRRIKLAAGPKSGFRLRTAPQPHCLSTIEAIARALGVLEGEPVRASLESLFSEMVERTMSTRGPARRR